MVYRGFIIQPVSMPLQSGRHDLEVRIIYNQGEQTGAHKIPTFEETFETEEEAIEFGFIEGKRLIDSGKLPQSTN